MAETVGWLTDKIIISELKIYHTAEQIQRKDASQSHQELCRARLKILRMQRDDLKQELCHLFQNIQKGKVRPKIYRQFKMYNDPRFFSKSAPQNSTR